MYRVCLLGGLESAVQYCVYWLGFKGLTHNHVLVTHKDTSKWNHDTCMLLSCELNTNQGSLYKEDFRGYELKME